jgi:hypothetical protein
LNRGIGCRQGEIAHRRAPTSRISYRPKAVSTLGKLKRCSRALSYSRGMRFSASQFSIVHSDTPRMAANSRLDIRCLATGADSIADVLEAPRASFTLNMFVPFYKFKDSFVSQRGFLPKLLPPLLRRRRTGIQGTGFTARQSLHRAATG